jgi:hypothetical protein
VSPGGKRDTSRDDYYIRSKRIADGIIGYCRGDAIAVCFDGQNLQSFLALAGYDWTSEIQDFDRTLASAGKHPGLKDANFWKRLGFGV